MKFVVPVLLLVAGCETSPCDFVGDTQGLIEEVQIAWDQGDTKTFVASVFSQDCPDDGRPCDECLEWLFDQVYGDFECNPTVLQCFTRE